jgi:hypothetical protein
MTSYVWGPFTAVNGVYTWQTGQLNWNVASNWLLGSSIDLMTVPPIFQLGDIPGSGLGGSSGALDDVTILSGQVGAANAAAFLSMSPVQSTDYYVDVLVNTDVTIHNLTLAGFNNLADPGLAQFPILDVHGATLNVTGSVFDTLAVGPLGVQATGGGEIELYLGAKVNIGGSVPADVLFHFYDGAANVLTLGGLVSTASQTIYGFTWGNTVHITNVAFASGQYQADASNQLTFVSGGLSYTLILDASAVGETFSVVGDALGTGSIITVACFCPGVRIFTSRGEIAVEDLRVGDLLATKEGLYKPVAWIGRSTVSARFADPVASFPVRIRAGALGDNVPCRDLLLSPDHALLIEGLLIHAGALVNGSSIVRETAIPETFVYYHVELDDHSVILADNTPAETFVDTVDRMNFDNWAEHEALYPAGRTMRELPYARVKARRQIPHRLRAAIDGRGQVLFPELAFAAA